MCAWLRVRAERKVKMKQATREAQAEIEEFKREREAWLRAELPEARLGCTSSGSAVWCGSAVVWSWLVVGVSWVVVWPWVGSLCDGSCFCSVDWGTHVVLVCVS